MAQIGIAGENRVRYAAVIHDVNRAVGVMAWAGDGIEKPQSGCRARTLKPVIINRAPLTASPNG